ncbi:arsenate reductase/protein-tyrosine-phosphatase family protein [Oceanicola sp. S124]|uniref:arsenate reductase/protein-tyrosine-phosphatase family protein n=1 Tax=Oceanicola sp. S124 TaxID=1042378 RepID=UPI0002559A0A|nr:ArsR family transcriptional regulator [Oceanicola sp. S124]
MEKEAVSLLSTLGHPQRLLVWRLLMRRYPQPVSAGEIAEATGLKASTLSVYLSALRQAGLIGQERQGTSLLYRAEIGTANDLLDYLFADCCRGRPALCLTGGADHFPLAPEGSAAMADRKLNVLFICTGNSARSIFAEALVRHLAGDRFNAYSAGTHPAGTPNPFAVKLLADKGIATEGLRSKDVNEFQGPDAPKMDFVFTVCDQAANEECPAWDGQPISAHWGMPDPARATGTDAEKALAFQAAYGTLLNRLRAFAALPVESLDRISLQSAVDEIALDETGAAEA